MSSYLYVKEVIKNVKKRFKEGGMEYNKSLSDINYFPKNLFSSVDYRPELDTSTEFNKYQVSFYQNLIEVIIWIMELRSIGIEF